MLRVVVVSSGGIRLPADVARLRSKVLRTLVAYPPEEPLELAFLCARVGGWGAKTGGLVPGTRWTWRAVGPWVPSRTPAPIVWLLGELTNPLYAWGLLRGVRALLFISMPHSGLAVALLARRQKVPVVVRLPAFTSDVMKAKRRPPLAVRAVAALEGMVMRRADVVSSVCQYSARVARDHGVPDDRIIVVGGPSSLPAEAQDAVEPPALVDGEEVRALCVARLTAEKGLSDAVKAVAVARARGLACSLRIAGEGPLRNELAQLCLSLGLDPGTVLVGWADKAALAGLYRWSSVVLCPSLFAEGICNVGLEAGFFARPVIGTGLGGMSDYLSNKVTGLVVPPGNVEALAEALLTIADPRMARTLGEANRRAALAHVAQRRGRVIDLRRRLDALLTSYRPHD